MSKQGSLWDIPNTISSQELASGVTLSGSQDGPTTGQSGPEVVPAPPLAQPAKAKGLQTLVTSGRNGFGSSASAALELSLASKLQRRLDTAGSTLFVEIWKRKATPLRRRYWEHTARVRPTSGSDCTSVPTPQVHDVTTRGNTEADAHYYPHDPSNTAILAGVPSPCTPNGGRSMSTDKMDATGRTEDGRKHSASLEHAVKFASVPTPMAGSPGTEAYNAAGNNDYSRKVVELATCATPRSEDPQCAGSHCGVPDTLHAQANLASISTPSSRDWEDTSGMSETGVDPDGSIRSRLDQLPRQAQLAASGPTAIGGTDATASIGQLDPEYSRWLMGLPPEWSSCAVTAMELFRKRPRIS